MNLISSSMRQITSESGYKDNLPWNNSNRSFVIVDNSSYLFTAPSAFFTRHVSFFICLSKFFLPFFFFASLFLSMFVYVFVYIFLFLYLSFSFSLSLSFYLSLSLSIYLSLSIFLYRSLPLSFFVSVCLSLTFIFSHII